MRKLFLFCFIIALLLGQTVSGQEDEMALIVRTWQEAFSPTGLEKIYDLIEAYPDWPEPYVMLAYYWYLHNDDENFNDEALTALQTAKNFVDENDLMFLEIEARIHYFLGNYEEAETLFLELINRFPSAAHAYQYLKLIYVEQNRYQDAISVIKLGQRANPLYIAFIHLEQEIYDLSGDEEAKAFVDLLDEAWDLWLGVDAEKALDSLREAVDLAAESDAIDDFDEAISLYWLQHYSRTWAYYEDFSAYSEEGDEAAQRIIELVPDWDLPFLVETRILLSLEEDEAAFEHLNEAIEQFPNNAEMYFQRGQLLEDRGQTENATADFWTYGQLMSLRQVDYSHLDLLNQSNRLPIGGGWQAIYNFEAEEGDEASFYSADNSPYNYLLALIDEQGNLLGVDIYQFTVDDSDDLALSVNIPENGRYSWHIICLDWNWTISYTNAEITLE
jgi:tetratricopeptide (TPR) repeat protein